MLIPHLPEFRFLLDDLSPAREAELHERVLTALGRVALFCLMRSRASADLLDELSSWHHALADVLRAQNGVAAFSRLMSYIAQTTDPLS